MRRIRVVGVGGGGNCVVGGGRGSRSLKELKKTKKKR